VSAFGAIQRAIEQVGVWFVKNKNIGTFIESSAVTQDSFVEDLRNGLALSQPLICDTSAFPVLSRDRQIRIFDSEPEISKRVRLSKWKQLHRQRGTHIGEMNHVAPYFLPAHPVMRIVHQNGTIATWHTLAADGTYSYFQKSPSNWNYDGISSHWSRFYFILYLSATGLAHYDDGGRYDSGERYDGIATQVALDVTQMILEWKSAHSRLGAVILATDPASFAPFATPVVNADGSTTLPIGNWGSPISPPPASVHTRLHSAIWLYEGAP